MSSYELHHGDCLDILPTLAAGSVDAVIADIPSGRTACAWDSVIPFDLMWEQLKRIAKKHSAIVLLGCTQPFTSALVMSNPKMFKYSLVWDKVLGSSPLNAPFQPLRTHEDICVFSESAATYSPLGTMTYIPQKTEGTPYIKRQPTRIVKQIYRTPVRMYDKINTTGNRYPVSILRFSGAARNKEHETGKPLALLEYLVKTYTNEGDTVLDFTFGSGTTGAACGNLGRSFIGIEKDAEYFRLGSERIATAYAPLRAMQEAV